MKPNQEQIEDQLLDALLHEHKRNDREAALADIEAALDQQKIETPVPTRSMWPGRLGVIAASIALGGLTVYWVDFTRRGDQTIAQQNTMVHIGPYKPSDISISKENLLDNPVTAYEVTKNEIKNSDPLPQLKEMPRYADTDRDRSAESEQLKEMMVGEELKPSSAPMSSMTKAIAGKQPSDAVKTGVQLAPSTTVMPAELAMNDKSRTTSRGQDFSLAGDGANGEFAGGEFDRGANGLRFRQDPGYIRDESTNSERYGQLIDPTWQRPTEAPLSTFSIDVDTASYANMRRMIREGRTIPVDAVRIEECINAFNYNYQPPTDDKAFAVHTELATCPWNKNNLIVKFGIKGREIAREKRPVSNLVFLIDVSGSMQSSNKLPLVKESLKLLLHQLDERDSVSYVVYAGSEGVVLSPTKMTEAGRVKALAALDKLEAGGSTNGGAGIKRAYQLAMDNFIEGGVNRVILASDGDFNVGVTGKEALVALVKERAAKNVYLSALAFGTGNLNDEMFEAISNDGNGNYFYIDTIREGRKVFLENLTGSLITIAKDVKIQVEFNPTKVGSYRLIGYANRVLKNEDFNNDKVDAGDIGAGHTVTAFYEIVPAGSPQPNAGGVDALKYQKEAAPVVKPAVEASDEWLTLKLRHKHPEGDISALQESVLKGQPTAWQESKADFQFATAVAMFGMKLRGMSEVSDIKWEGIRELAQPGLKNDKNEDRAEFVELIGELEKRSR